MLKKKEKKWKKSANLRGGRDEAALGRNTGLSSFITARDLHSTLFPTVTHKTKREQRRREGVDDILVQPCMIIKPKQEISRTTWQRGGCHHAAGRSDGERYFCYSSFLLHLICLRAFYQQENFFFKYIYIYCTLSQLELQLKAKANNSSDGCIIAFCGTIIAVSFCNTNSPCHTQTHMIVSSSGEVSSGDEKKKML